MGRSSECVTAHVRCWSVVYLCPLELAHGMSLLLSNNEQDARHKLYMWHGVLSGILVSIILLCLAAFVCALVIKKIKSINYL